MIPRPFAYERPATVEEAVALLAEAGEREIKVLAGGQSLVPMMSLGLARPELVVDVGELELGGLERANGHVRVGALTTHRTLELGEEARSLLPLAATAARHVGNARVRNRGTLGGSLAHADPAAELGAVVLAHGGFAVARGPDGERRIPVEDLFLGPLTTSLAPEELLVAVELCVPEAGSGVGFEEAANRADDFATAAAGAIVTLTDNGRSCASARIALAGTGPRPVRVRAAEELVRGEPLASTLLAAVGRAAEAAVEAGDTAFVSAAFRRRVAGACARRAFERAWRSAR
ncbi:MAG: FAD binding domain-containing protein [Thermoleophilia bacterium]|nr:FAD binding domain-containing protein [Thermoleophilia bacterium]